jgi:sugar lactone lactonase YvrE
MLTRDLGPEPAAGVYAYVASSWKGDNNNQAEIRLHRLVNDAQKLPAPRDTRMGSGEDPPVLTPTWKFPEAQKVGLGGLAAWNGLVVASLTKMDALLFVDAPRSNVLGTVALAAPRGLAFDRQGRLLAVSSNRIVRLALPPKAQCRDQMALPAPEVLVTDGLEEPQQLALDQAGALLYVSDRGKCNQVKVFAIAEPPARLVRAIGSAGVAKAGPYDPLQMHKPKGIALDDRGRLWVAEDDHQPKRVSVWSADGQLVKAYYGPPQYGGGGVLDPEDKTLFYHNGMTFALDWTAGQSHLMALRWRPGRRDFDIAHEHNSGGPPDTPVYFKGRKYYTDCFVGNPTGGSQVFNLWRDRGGVAVPAASFGKAGAWQWLTNDVFLAMIPADTKRKRDASKPARGGLGQGIPAPALRWEATAGKEAGTPTPESKAPATVGVPPSGGPHPVTDPLPKPPDLDGVVYAWSDLNGDGVGQPEEVQFARTDAGMVQYMRTPSHRQTAQPEASPHLFSPYSWVGRTLWVSRPQSGRVTPS